MTFLRRLEDVLKTSVLAECETSNKYLLCYSDQNIVQFILEQSIEFTVERYKEIGKPYSKIDNVSNVDNDVNLKVIG